MNSYAWLTLTMAGLTILMTGALIYGVVALTLYGLAELWHHWRMWRWKKRAMRRARERKP